MREKQVGNEARAEENSEGEACRKARLGQKRTVRDKQVGRRG